jgi:DNA-binding SARP family transcriptional activator
MAAGVIEIRLLGRFSARRSGEEIPPTAFGGRLTRTLVRLLITHRGEFVSHDVLADALWPGRLPADPVASLQVLVTRARRALGDRSLLITGASVRQPHQRHDAAPAERRDEHPCALE